MAKRGLEKKSPFSKVGRNGGDFSDFFWGGDSETPKRYLLKENMLGTMECHGQILAFFHLILWIEEIF